MTYIGVDLDGTLADHSFVWPSIGGPIAAMVARVKAWRSQGVEVRIVTARAQTNAHQDYQPNRPPEMDWDQINRIWLWCEEHIGEQLPVQFWKDYGMSELWDDRARQVIQDTGEPVG